MLNLPVLSSAYVAISLGIILGVLGLYLKWKENEGYSYFLIPSSILLLTGISLMAYFLYSFN